MTLAGIACLLAGAVVTLVGGGTLVRLFLGVVLLGVGFVLLVVAGSRRPASGGGP